MGNEELTGLPQLMQSGTICYPNSSILGRKGWLLENIIINQTFRHMCDYYLEVY